MGTKQFQVYKISCRSFAVGTRVHNLLASQLVDNFNPILLVGEEEREEVATLIFNNVDLLRPDFFRWEAANLILVHGDVWISTISCGVTG